MPDFKGNCSATAIGSFPHKEPEAAFKLITKTLPEIPCWPQLPKRAFQEEMCVQYTEGMPFFRLLPKERRFYLEVCEDAEVLESLYTKFQEKDFSSFSISPDFASGLYVMGKHFSEFPHLRAVKGQTVGPVTLAGNLKDPQGVAAFHDPTVFDAVIKHLCLKAQWQVNLLSQVARATPSKDVPVILFVDEPYLSCLGAAFATIEKDDVVKSLNELFGCIHASEALAGIHCCGNTDWAMVMSTQVDILSFDAFAFMDKVLAYWRDIGEFIKRGGILSWGIAPTTSGDLKDVTLKTLMEMMEEGIGYLSKRGIEEQSLLLNSLITPSCGTGTLSVEESEKAMYLTLEVSCLLRERYHLRS
jgi:hypothetical protein